MLPYVRSVISHRWHKDVVRTKKGALMFLSHFDTFCDLSVHNGNIESICFVYKKNTKKNILWYHLFFRSVLQLMLVKPNQTEKSPFYCLNMVNITF